MDRVLSTDERIRRAEEIYLRRRENKDRRISTRVNISDNKSNLKLFKKLILQILICVFIYSVFLLIKSSNYIFSEEFIAKAKEVLNYDINIQEKYNTVISFFNKSEEDKETLVQEEKKTFEEAIGGAEAEEANISSVTEEVPQITEETSSISQERIDADDILANYSLIKPLTGTITSRFGLRNPTTASVPKYHTGIDIAASTGTKFIASMEGEVVLVSSYGDYR